MRISDTYAGEVMIGFFYNAKRMRSRAARAVYTRVYDGVVGGYDRILETVQGEHIYARGELVPDNGGVDARELFVVFAGDPGFLSVGCNYSKTAVGLITFTRMACGRPLLCGARSL